MAGRAVNAGEGRAKGSIKPLRSGALRVRVYAGIDPVTRKRHYLTEVIERGPKASQKAEAARARLLDDVRQRRNPRTNATVDQLLSRYLAQWRGAPGTLAMYRGYIRNHVSPFLGHLKVGDLDAEGLDSLYSELQRCRSHCSGRPRIEHRTATEHECDQRCRPHVCRPLGATTVRHIHGILSGAYKRAVRWRWVAVNPMTQAEPPAPPPPNPQPPAASEAARIVTEAWRQDLDWGALIWVTITTGARRGELCAIRWNLVDLTESRETIWLQRAIRKENGVWVEAELKTHQQRRVALDQGTVAVLREYRKRCEARADALGIELAPDAFVFSMEPDSSVFRNPEGVSQRYDRLAERLKIRTTFHKLRHYSATELILAGVDIKTVAGRLGHGGGGVTTLRTYVAWVSEADQRAATGLGAGMPRRPAPVDPGDRPKTDPRYPYEHIAAELRQQIMAGAISNGATLAPEKQLCAEHDVSKSTVRRAVLLLRQWGLLSADDRRVITPKTTSAGGAPAEVTELGTVRTTAEEPPSTYWAVTLRGPDGQRYPARLVRANLTAPDSFRPHVVGIARIEAPEHAADGEHWISNYELEVREPNQPQDAPATLTLRWESS